MWRYFVRAGFLLIFSWSINLYGTEIVEVETVMGNFQIELLDQDAPNTVANFLNYAERGVYDGSFIHRSVPGFVIQGGGYVYNSTTSSAVPITADPAIANEFNVSNTRGTVAMAKLGNDPDSATSQWFINLADNTNLDSTNGGYTVFGRVLNDGMNVVDAIAALPRRNFGSPFNETPTIDYKGTITEDIFVTVTRIFTPQPASFGIDISAEAPITGLWWNSSESGWGITLTQQANIIFATLFTYDSAGLPLWYVASDCRVTGNRCTGLLYHVTGGTPISDQWNSINKETVEAGSITLTFTGNDTGELSFIIDGVNGNKTITRQVWSTLSPGEPMTGLWWNSAEPGWGVTLTRQTDIAFATLFTYASSGLPTWYVASDCAVSGNGCSGALYQVTGGSELTAAWNGENLIVDPVGTIEFVFSDNDTGTMSFLVNDITGTKPITRQVWAVP